MLATTDLKHTSWSNCLWHKVNKPKSSSLATIGVLRERGSGGFAQRYFCSVATNGAATQTYMAYACRSCWSLNKMNLSIFQQKQQH